MKTLTLTLLETSRRVVSFVQQYVAKAWHVFDTMLLFLVSLSRVAVGKSCASGVDKCDRPTQLLKLFDCESNPECRLVRETLNVLDLDYQCLPCPRELLGGSPKPLNSRYRSELEKTGGLLKVPLLVDAGKNVKIYFAGPINEYLWKTYGSNATKPLSYKIAQHPYYLMFSEFFSLMCRPLMSMGVLRAPSYRPAQPLELWGCEASPFSRRVKETLCTLEIPYIMHTVAGGSASRKAFREEQLNKMPGGFKGATETSIQHPMLLDPNEKDIRILESHDIVQYLTGKYQTYMVSDDAWLEADGKGREFENGTTGSILYLAIVGPLVWFVVKKVCCFIL